MKLADVIVMDFLSPVSSAAAGLEVGPARQNEEDGQVQPVLAVLAGRGQEMRKVFWRGIHLWELFLSHTKHAPKEQRKFCHQ